MEIEGIIRAAYTYAFIALIFLADDSVTLVLLTEEHG